MKNITIRGFDCVFFILSDLDLCLLLLVFKLGYTVVAMKKTSTTLRSNLKLVLIASVAFIAAQAKAFFDPYQVYRAQRFDLVTDTQFFKSTANFDSSGEKTSLPFDNSYQLIDVNPQLRWAMFQNFGVRFGANIGSAESIDTLNTRSNSTLNRLDIGADYLVFSSNNFQTILDFEYSHALEKISETTDDVLNNNGTGEIKPTALLRMDLGSFYPFAYLGGNFRSEGLSSLLTYGGGGEFRFSELGVGAAIKGFSSVKDDQYTNSASRRDLVTSRVSAGSKKFYSINPNSLSAEVFLNFAMTDFMKFKAYGGTDLTGSNYAQGFFVGGALTFTLDYGVKDFSEFNNQRTRPAIKKTNTIPVESDFHEDTEDGVDQNYFKSVDPGKEDYVQPIHEESQDSTFVPQSGASGSSIDPNGQDNLDQMGYSLKLKKLKKKKKKKSN